MRRYADQTDTFQRRPASVNMPSFFFANSRMSKKPGELHKLRSIRNQITIRTHCAMINLYAEVLVQEKLESCYQKEIVELH
jgi:hypothetical protein